MAVQAQPKPVVDDEPPLQGLPLVTLRRVMGRLGRRKKTGKNGQVLGFHQSESWTLRCIPHLAEKDRTKEILLKSLDDLMIAPRRLHMEVMRKWKQFEEQGMPLKVL